MSTVAVTGVAGYLGGALLRRLAGDPEVERIIGVDVLEPAPRPKKMTFHRIDIRDPDLVKAIDGADSVVHLAFLLGAGYDERFLRDVNVGGLCNVLEAMESAGASHLVYPSSALVYGAHRDNDQPLTEDSPARPNPGSPFGRHKAECEAHIEEWLRRHPGFTAAILRLALVFGPHVDNVYSRILESPVMLSAKGYAPSLSVVHEDDAASALHLALSRRLGGVFNVCADDPLSWHDLLDLAGKREVRVSESALRALTQRMSAAGLLDIAPGEMPYYLHPWAMTNQRLRAEGWAPAYSAREAVGETIRANWDYVSVGAVRGTRRQWSRMLTLTASGLSAAIVLGAVAARGLARRRRKARRGDRARAALPRLGRPVSAVRRLPGRVARRRRR